jgi:toxin-antitoxin system PIN domain toxin
LIALDTNLLVYAHRRDSPWHEDAAARVRALAEGSANWAIPWPCIHEFLGLVTHPRIYAPPTPLTKALAQVSAWLESPTLVLLAEGEGYGSVLSRLLERSRAAGTQIQDARIAALCIHHGVRELWSADRDFSGFGELRARNPLTSP